MRVYTVKTEPVKVSINGDLFELLKADAIAQAEIIQFLSKAGSVEITTRNDVEAVLRAGCDLVDSLLGNGACYRIFGNNPVSLGGLFALLMQICKDCVRAYSQYLKSEYLEGWT